MPSVVEMSLFLVIGLLALLASGLPIGIVFAIIGTLFIFIYRGPAGIDHIGVIAWETVTGDTIITLPLFVLMGEFLFIGRLGEDLFDVTSKWLGRMPGGLAVASQGACTLFGAVCGSSIATTATIGTVFYPEMRKHGYSEELSAGILSCGGGVGILIPPSIPFVVYALLAEESVGKMFMAGVIPGLLMSALFMTYCAIYASLRPGAAPRTDPVSWKVKFVSLRKLWSILVLVIVVLVALYAGIVTATEAAAFGAIAAFLVVFLHKHASLPALWGGVMSTIRMSAFIGVVLIGANIMNYAIAWSGIPGSLMEFLAYSGAVPRWAIIPATCALFFMLGMFMDSLAVMLLILPTLMPAVHVLHIDPIWFGVIMVVNIELALITPPVAMNVFVIQHISGLPMNKVFKGVFPFVGVALLGLIILIIFPILSTWLPSTMK